MYSKFWTICPFYPSTFAASCSIWTNNCVSKTTYVSSNLMLKIKVLKFGSLWILFMSSPPSIAFTRGKHLVPNIWSWSERFLHFPKTANSSLRPWILVAKSIEDRRSFAFFESFWKRTTYLLPFIASVLKSELTSALYSIFYAKEIFFSSKIWRRSLFAD